MNVPLITTPTGLNFSLAMGTDKTSLKMASLLSQFDVPFKVYDGSEGPVPPPVLTVSSPRSDGRAKFTYVGAEKIQNFLRRWALREDDNIYGLIGTDLYGADGIKFPWSDKGTSLVCFNKQNVEIFRGLIEKSPYPVLPVFEKGKLGGVGGMSKIAVWEICDLDDSVANFHNCANMYRPFISKTPPAVLMPDEVKLFDKTRTNETHITITWDEAFMAYYWFEAYFTQKRTLYRVWGHNPD
ncbi:MAG: hypothetical protein G01um101456_547 [Parcubacteria group bacterium Gr01-1014_56]|nr:MAG: hypothetical protein G01um101456_547 [Parcubacteria group bacterium Gr01-1014_56]